MITRLYYGIQVHRCALNARHGGAVPSSCSHPAGNTASLSRRDLEAEINAKTLDQRQRIITTAAAGGVGGYMYMLHLILS